MLDCEFGNQSDCQLAVKILTVIKNADPTMTAKTRPKAGILRRILKVICCRKDPAEEIEPKSLFSVVPVKRKRTLKGNSKSAKF